MPFDDYEGLGVLCRVVSLPLARQKIAPGEDISDWRRCNLLY